MVNYEIRVVDTDTGNVMASASDSVAEGETDVYEVAVEDPSPTASLRQTSGN